MILNIFRNTEKELQKARLKLKAELRNNDLSFLLNQMNSNEIYSPLLKKKRRTEISNTDDVSWYAYRRAEELNSETEKKGLLNFLQENENPELRQHIYFALAHLCKNRIDNELFNFLMDRLETEKDKKIKSKILVGVKEMPKSRDLNIEPLKKLAKIRSRDLKIDAIIALQKTDDPEVEKLLLDIFQTTKDNHTKSMICVPLRTVGSKNSIPILESTHKKTRDFDLRYFIESALEEIKNRNSAANKI